MYFKIEKETDEWSELKLLTLHLHILNTKYKQQCLNALIGKGKIKNKKIRLHKQTEDIQEGKEAENKRCRKTNWVRVNYSWKVFVHEELLIKK